MTPDKTVSGAGHLAGFKSHFGFIHTKLEQNVQYNVYYTMTNFSTVY